VLTVLWYSMARLFIAGLFALITALGLAALLGHRLMELTPPKR